MSERLEKAAALYDEVAEHLERAAAHASVAAQHFRDENIPRGAAHAWALHGHLLEVQERLDAQAREHARHSEPEA
jgi:TPR repeat protein